MQDTVVILEGTFDPPHIGHYWGLREAMERYNADGLVVISSDDSVKYISRKDHAQSQDTRAQLCYRSFVHDTNVSVLPSPGLMYTIEVLDYVQQKYGWKKHIILSGLDWKKHKWYKHNELREKAEFYVVPEPMIRVRSTTIRERVSNNLPITGLVHPSIEDRVRIIYA